MSDPQLNPDDVWPSGPDDQRLVRDALDRLLLGFQVIGFDWKYLYVNPAAARHGRRTPRELVGKTMDEAYPGFRDTGLFRRLDECMRQRVTATFENEFAYPDGTKRRFEVRVQPVPKGICIYSEAIGG